MTEWKLVPVEPTEAMMESADAVDWSNEDERGSVINMWHTMLAAAPPPPTLAENATVAPPPVQQREAAELYVPGEFRCAKCGFTLSQFTLDAGTGVVSDRDHPGERCPNDGSPLWRVTWKERAHEHYQRAVEEIQRNSAREEGLREALDKVRAEFTVEYLPSGSYSISHSSDALPRIIELLDRALSHADGDV